MNKYQCWAILRKAMGCEDRKVERKEIEEFLRKNSKNVLLWLIAAGALDGKQRFDCLERALKLDPQNKKIFGLMMKVNRKRAYRVARRMNLEDY